MENAAGAAEKPRETTALPCSPTPDRVLITIIYLRNVSSQKVLSELTGMSRHRLQRLTGRLAIPHAAAIERRRYRQRGADRLPGTRGGIFRQKITDTDPDPGHDPGDRGLEPGVRVGDDQLDATQAAGLQGSQERSPERTVFAVPDIETRGLRGARRRRPRRPRPRPGRSPGGSPGPCSRSRPGTRRERPSGPGARVGPGTPRPRCPGRRRSGSPRTWRSPLSVPSALTRSSTLRVEVPCRRSSSDGKNDPVRSRGIFRSRSPAVVAIVRGRCPLRCAGPIR